MTKADYIAKVAKKSSFTQKDTNIVIEAAIEVLTQLLKEDDSISFVDFGSFSTVHKAAREVKIPSSGKIVQVPPKRAVKFKVGKALKETVA